MMTVGQRIQEVRKARGYSQEAVANDLGISPTAYSKIERNETDVNISRLEQIAKVLQVETWAFFLPQGAINIIGDIKESTGSNVGHRGIENIYQNDFTEERKAYQKHIESQDRHIQNLEKQLDEKQAVIDSFLKKH